MGTLFNTGLLNIRFFFLVFTDIYFKGYERYVGAVCADALRSKTDIINAKALPDSLSGKPAVCKTKKNSREICPPGTDTTSFHCKQETGRERCPLVANATPFHPCIRSLLRC